MLVDLLEDIQKGREALRPVAKNFRRGQPGDRIFVMLRRESNTLANFREPLGYPANSRGYAIHPPETRRRRHFSQQMDIAAKGLVGCPA